MNLKSIYLGLMMASGLSLTFMNHWAMASDVRFCTDSDKQAIEQIYETHPVLGSAIKAIDPNQYESPICDVKGTLNADPSNAFTYRLFYKRAANVGAAIPDQPAPSNGPVVYLVVTVSNEEQGNTLSYKFEEGVRN